MHQVLDLPEILYNIFGHLAPDEDGQWTYERSLGTCTLARLARTCRVFKEPALDVLWSVLPDLSTLARCVPEAVWSKRQCYYAFKRPLTEAEWDTTRSYARRVWIFLNCTLRGVCLEEESIAMLLNYAGDTLFPSLRFVSWGYGGPLPLLCTVSQQLRILHLDFRCTEIPEYLDILESVGNLCPFMKKFRLHLSRQYGELDSITSSHVLRWSSLRVLDCCNVALSADAISHISRMSTLTDLSFVLDKEASGQILSSDIDLIFLNLMRCDITSGWLSSVASLFARTRLPAIRELTIRFPGSPSKQTIRSFMMALRNACSSSTLTHLSILSQRYLLRQLSACGDIGLNGYPITYDDLYPCMAHGNLRSLKLEFEQPVHLTDDDVVDLGSAWPNLEELAINSDSGWRSTGGLTLHGLVRLLRACPVLCHFCILFDTLTFTSIPEDMNVSYPPRQLGCINLVESPLDADMFAGVVDVFVRLEFSPRLLIAWRHLETGQRTPMGLLRKTFRSWRDLDDEVKARIGRGGSDSKESVCKS